MAWVRGLGSSEELVVASDSRLRAGYAWDAAPKLIPLPRGDSVLAFAGSTEFAYPIMIQAWNAVTSWSKALNRTQPLPKLKGHLVRVFNGMLAELTDLPKFEENVTPDAVFLLAGYSWSEDRFRIWTLHYDGGIKRFTFRPASPWRGSSNRGKVLVMVGDAVAPAREQLIDLLRERRKLSRYPFDYEPLEILYRIIADAGHPTVGGPVQVVKVYRSLNAVPFLVSQAGGRSTLLGRPLLDYEAPDRHPSLELADDGSVIQSRPGELDLPAGDGSDESP